MEACEPADIQDVLRLMRLERICRALDVEPPVAAMLAELADRVAELEARLRQLDA